MKTKDIVTGIIKHSKISVYLHIQLGSISVWALMAARFKVGHFLREQHKETSTSNPFLCAADFFLQLGSCKEAVR